MSDILRELEEREKEVAQMRRQNADWNYINTLPPRVRAAVILFIEKGDLRLSQKLSGLDLEDFIETLRKARVWIT
uniref:PaREP6 n=1 Tax=Thermofilum adornatum TaxID=1365176 RepID=A0A7C1CDI0_9CREN